MKKSMIIALIVVYLASIVAVNFFGLQAKNFEGTLYVSSIECDVALVDIGDGDTREVKEKADKLDSTLTNYTFDFVAGTYDDSDASIQENPNKVVVQYHVYPETADNRNVKFIFDHEAAKDLVVFKEDIAMFVFLRWGGLTVTIEAEDGSQVKEKIYIFAKPTV